ncbi:MAG: transcriptional regulator [Legionellales bacterium]|nr:transcriptional regulator [Legionellales bacterium]|tara:strand:- start:97287 stop:97532 length:246 start_codon:yes stop_codon:yes gene_type:complete
MEFLANSPKLLGVTLKRARQQKGLSQAEVGEPFGIQQSTISSIENGAPGTQLETLYRVLASLDLELFIRPREHKEMTEDEW